MGPVGGVKTYITTISHIFFFVQPDSVINMFGEKNSNFNFT